MKQRIERRSVAAEYRISDENGKPTIYGYAAKFNVRSSDLGGWYERIAPNAFTRNLATTPAVKGLFNHDSNFVLGSTSAKTMTVRADNVGLQYQIDPPDTQWARDLVTSMKRGDINQSSFGFICRNATWSTDPETGCDLRTVTDADLIDASVVTYPAYPQATSGVRSLPADMPLEVRKRLTTRDLGESICDCLCPECVGGDCCDCSDPDCDDPDCVCATDGDDDGEANFNSKSDTLQETRRNTTTKAVDGENLTADDFLIVGDPDKTDTWHLPWQFSTEEKTASHLRDALSRFDQVQGVSDDVKKAAWDKLVKLCKEHQIDVSDDDANRSMRIRVMLRSLNDLA